MYSKLKNLSLNGIINKDEEILLNTTKTKSKENKNINLSISNFEKNNIIFNLFEKMDKNKYTTITNESFYDDLNIFDKDKNSVFNILNKTETLFGEIELRKMLYFPLLNIKTLSLRQYLIKKILLIRSNIIPFLKKIKQKENDIIWLFKKKNDEENEYLNNVYCSSSWFKWINNIPILLNIIHYYNIIICPISSIISPFISIIISYIIFRFMLGFKIGIFEFYKIFNLGFDTSFNFLGNNFQLLSKIIYGIMYIISVYKTIMSAYNTMELCKIIYEKIASISTLVNAINSINFILIKENIFTHFWNDSLDKDFNKINKIFGNYKNYNFFQDWGTIFYKFLQIEKYSDNIANLLNYVAQIDVYISITKISDSKEVNFTQYLNNKKPLIIVKDIIHPSLSENKNVVKNSLNLEKFKNILLFGPNASGKSLFIKSLIINILLSQTLTISYSKNMSITPFSILNTYINIPDTVGKESLFEAEVHRCKNYISRIKNIKDNKFSLTVFDELFSSTNYHEGLSTSYSICKYLTKYQNTINIITTHFNKLSILEKEKLFKCYKMKVSQDNNRKIRFHYRLKPGISKKKLAIELLRTKGLDKEIIDCALDFYNKRFVKKNKGKKKRKIKKIYLKKKSKSN